MDVNEYYNLMGQIPKDETWKMPVYNTFNNGVAQPITGAGRKASSSSVKSTGQQTNTAQPANDIYMNCNFVLTISDADTSGKNISAGFTKVSGIEAEWELESYEEGGYNGVHYFPKQLKYPHLVMEYGITHNAFFSTWFFNTVGGGISRLTMVLSMLGTAQTTVAAWQITDAYPVKYIGPDMNALSSEVAITRIEFVHSGIVPLS
jgi:phage tail-like protein